MLVAVFIAAFLLWPYQAPDQNKPLECPPTADCALFEDKYKLGGGAKYISDIYSNSNGFDNDLNSYYFPGGEGLSGDIGGYEDSNGNYRLGVGGEFKPLTALAGALLITTIIAVGLNVRRIKAILQ